MSGTNAGVGVDGDPAGRPPGAAARAPGLEVPVAPLGGRRRRVRGRLAALAVAGGLVLVVGAALTGSAPDGRRDSAVVRATDTSTRAPTARPSAPATATVPAADDDRPEALPELASTDLPGSPVAIFHGRRNDDLLRYGWAPGDHGLSRLASVPDAFVGFGAQTAIVVVESPAGGAWAVRGLGSLGGGPGDRVRLVTADGTELWSATDAEGNPIVPIWSPDGDRVALPGAGTTWRVLTLRPDGTVGDPLVVQAREDAERALEPAGFSVDGRWLYAIERRVGASSWRPSHRVSTEDGRSEAISRLPIAGSEALAVVGRLGPMADPLTGRRYSSPSLALSTGPTDVEVWEPDGSFAFVVELDAVMGLAWAGDGRLLALEADQLPEPSRVRLVAIDEHGRVSGPLIESGALTWAGIVGVRDGHVLLAFSTSGSDGEGMLAMLRLEDGATATLRLDRATFGDLLLGGWATGA